MIVAEPTCAAGTGSTVPTVMSVSLGRNVTLARVTFVIPTGHVGITGIALRYAGVRILPFQPAAFIRGDGEAPPFDFGFPVASGTIDVEMFNDDVVDHSWFVRFEVEDIELRPAVAAFEPLDPAAIEGSAVAL